MEKIPDSADISGNSFSQERTLHETAATPGAIILEMKREEPYPGKPARRLEELTKLAAVQKRVVSRMLDRSIEKPLQPKRPHLTVIK